MAGPDILAARTLQAIEEDDPKAFARWVKHPRWAKAGWEERWGHAALRSSNPCQWLERLSEVGVSRELGFRQPLVCEAARLNNAPVLEWLLERGANPQAVSDFGLGLTPGAYALEHDAFDAMEALWRHTRRGWSLVGIRQSGKWVEEASRPMLNRLADAGWSPDTPEMAPLMEGPQSFRQRIAELRATVSIPASLDAWLESRRLAVAMPAAMGTPSRPRL